MMTFIAFSFGYTTLAVKENHEAAEHFVCNRGPSTKDSKNGYLCMLIDSKYNLLLPRENDSLLIVTYSLSEN